jgi:hypothetical protein
MEDLTFLGQLDGDYGANNATIKVVDPEGFVSHISDCVCPYRLLDNCPLLYHAFEHGSRGRLQASIEAPSRAAVISLLRQCYTGSYLPVYMEDVPPVLLLHAHVYKIAEDFDVPELQLSAHGNFSVQIESACSLPTPPQDFLETIRYVYANFASPQARQQQGLVHTLLNYCISVFLSQRLGGCADFLAVVRQLPEFRQDLCRTNMERNFQDDCEFAVNLGMSQTNHFRRLRYHQPCARYSTTTAKLPLTSGSTRIQRSTRTDALRPTSNSSSSHQSHESSTETRHN